MLETALGVATGVLLGTGLLRGLSWARHRHRLRQIKRERQATIADIEDELDEMRMED